MRCYRFDEAVLDRLAAVLSYYLGHFRLASTWKLWQSIWQKFEFLSQYFAFDEDSGKLIRLYPMPQTFRRVRNQYRYFRWRFPDDVLFFQVGRFMECYDVGTPDWTQWLGLRRMGRNRRGARYGFPARATWRHLATLMSAGCRVLMVAEQAGGLGGICRRTPLCRYVPVSEG